MRSSKVRTLTAGAAFLAALFALPQAVLAGADIQIVNLDAGTGQGLDDPTPVAPVGGNPGTTLGEQRLNVFETAAQIWEAVLTSDVTILVEATFTPLSCNAFSAVLGAAGAQTVHANFANAPVADTWFHAALANSLAGSDLDAGTADIISFFNSSIDNNNNCLSGINWYYGLDSNPPGNDIDFQTVILHEIGHGLGVSSFVDESSGALLGPPFLHDIWNDFLLDATSGLTWRQMSNAQRAASAINTGNLTWSGASVTALAPQLSAGVNLNGFVQMYAPNPVEPGSSVSHWDTAATPNLLMEPFITGPTNDLDFTPALLEDIGWVLMAPGGFTLADPVPGQAGVINDFGVSGATAGGRVHLVASRQTNPVTVNVGDCGPVTFDIGTSIRRLGSTTADGSGDGTISAEVPAGVSGQTIHFQAFDAASCSTSNVVSFAFP